MTIAPTIYGFPSAEWNLPDDMAYVSEAVEAWRGWEWGDLALTIGGGLDLFIWLRGTIEYSSNMNVRWPLPETVMASPSDGYLRCDCEGFACAFASAWCHAFNQDPEDIFITVYDDRLTKNIHAVCVVRTEEGNKVLDQRAIEVMDDTPDPDIRPIFSIALNGAVFLHGEPQ